MKSFIKLDTVVSMKNAVVLNWRSHAELHIAMDGQMLCRGTEPKGFLELGFEVLTEVSHLRFPISLVSLEILPWSIPYQPKPLF